MARGTILYIEDDAANLALVRKVLEHGGEWTVVGASAGEAGLALLETLEPALVLIDLDLPDMDGFEVARQIRAAPKTAHIPTVAISANVMKKEQQRAIEAGCKSFLEKPFDIRELRSVVEAAVSSPPAT